MTWTNSAETSMSNLLFLLSSFFIGLFGIALCGLARWLFMNSPADWLSFDYSTTGWCVRFASAIVGICAFGFALLARKHLGKHFLRRWLYRTDIALALIAIAFEIAIPAILLIIIIGLIGDSFSGSIGSDSIGCLVGGLSAFDFFDFDD
jgi:hypothetical protein